MVKFEKVKRIEEDIKLPERSTLSSAGYDFFAINDITIPAHTTQIVMTGIKCELMPNMALILANRSSNPIKKGLLLINGIGIIDADYYSNDDNDGEIGFAFYNMKDTNVEIKKGDKLGQGLIVNFIKTEDDYTSCTKVTRAGGFGSTGK